MLNSHCFRLDAANEANEWHTQAAELLIRYNIPITPVCYHVAYEYAAQRHDELTRIIDAQLNKTGHLDSHFLFHLFENFCLEGAENDKLDDHLADLHNLLFKVLEGVTNNCSQTDLFSETLLSQSHALDANPSLEDLRGIAQTLMQATAQAMQNNRMLQDHLESAEEQSLSLQSEVKKLRDEISTDALTGLFNRRALNKRMHELVEAHNGASTPFSILMLDIDHFKQFNDNFGHVIGDEVIRRVGLIMRDKLRDVDFPARYGGEEFTVLLPGTDITHAMSVAETIHHSVAKLILIKRSTKEKLPSVTVSVGAASCRRGDSPETLLERADQALYQAKEGGRNRIVSEAEITYM
ncbi:MAG: GGDEF domain-containing protein [Candidatus Thiodiazotropha endolucinida]